MYGAAMSGKLVCLSLEIGSSSNDDCLPKARLHLFKQLGYISQASLDAKLQQWSLLAHVYTFWGIILFASSCIYFKEITKVAAITDLFSIMGNEAFQHTWYFWISEAIWHCQNFTFSAIFQGKISKIYSTLLLPTKYNFFWWLMLNLIRLSNCIEPEHSVPFRYQSSQSSLELNSLPFPLSSCPSSLHCHSVKVRPFSCSLSLVKWCWYDYFSWDAILRTTLF